MSQSPPSTLGKYQIIREIARSNDIVYEAYDPLMHRRVAVKELAMPTGITDVQKEERLKRFHREARAAGSLTHPNIMTVFEVGEEAGRHFIAMEYLDGHNLRNEVDTKGSLPPDRAAEITLEVLKGLEYSHANGVIHRDIKPENVQILSDGRIKLTDFGIARLTFEPNLTMDGQVFGTPSYMSPEQVVGRDIDARSDLFSAGVLLYEMIAGRKPFTGDSVVSLTYAIVNHDPAIDPQIPHRYWQVIQQALEKSPPMRYAGAAEMIQALTACRDASYGVVIDPMLPPVRAPYLGVPPGGAVSAPPSPWGAPPAQGTPPAFPVPGAPYNPYQTGPVPPGASVPPIYYPPPPRKPLLKPETRQFIGRLMMAFVILGSLFALITVGIDSLSTAFERTRAQGQEDGLLREVREIDPNQPIEARISEAEARYRQLKTPEARREGGRMLAALMEIKGKEHLAEGQETLAEETFLRALEFDPNSPALHSDLGDLYQRIALRKSEPFARLELWASAAQAWTRAAEASPAGEARKQYALAAAEAYYNEAVLRLQAGERLGDVRDLLYEAQRHAPSDSQVARTVEELLRRLRE